MPEVIAVIGKNYGDEGKGLAVQALSRETESLVIRHNGGAQAGHTAEGAFGRFVFHQLGSGSFAGAETLLSDTFLVDLYQLTRETEAFEALSGRPARVFADRRAFISVPDDVLINMALETARGDNRHGSCGMGIYEAQLRAGAGYGITVGEAAQVTAEQLYRRLSECRAAYSYERLRQSGLAGRVPPEYDELLRDDLLLRGAAEAMKRGLECLVLTETEAGWLRRYPRIIFENAQGLLLDADYLPGQPHVTASRTGLTQPVRFCARYGLSLRRALYVTRSYVTRHGAGPLPHACPPETLGAIGPDPTNVPNPWQGSLRYARHPDLPDFAQPVSDDLRQAPAGTEAELLVTHLNETGYSVQFASGSVKADALPGFLRTRAVSCFSRFWISDDPFGFRPFGQ